MKETAAGGGAGCQQKKREAAQALKSTQIQVQITVLPLTSHVTLEKLLSQVYHLDTIIPTLQD